VTDYYILSNVLIVRRDPHLGILSTLWYCNPYLKHVAEEITCMYENTNHQQLHKDSFIINPNTLLHVSTLLGHLQGELFCYHHTKFALYSWVRMCCWLCTGGVVFGGVVFGGVNFLWSRPSRVETCKSVLRLMIKLSLCICWWLVFLYNIAHGHGAHYNVHVFEVLPLFWQNSPYTSI
jgi:hypothetical protein